MENAPGFIAPVSPNRLGLVQAAKVRSPEERRQQRSCIKDRGELESGGVVVVGGGESLGVNLINNKFPSAPQSHALCLIVLY